MNVSQNSEYECIISQGDYAIKAWRPYDYKQKGSNEFLLVSWGAGLSGNRWIYEDGKILEVFSKNKRLPEIEEVDFLKVVETIALGETDFNQRAHAQIWEGEFVVLLDTWDQDVIPSYNVNKGEKHPMSLMMALPESETAKRWLIK